MVGQHYTTTLLYNRHQAFFTFHLVIILLLTRSDYVSFIDSVTSPSHNALLYTFHQYFLAIHETHAKHELLKIQLGYIIESLININ